MNFRIAPIDWMRGLAMVLMAVDHAGAAFNPNRPVGDSVYFYDPALPLDGLEFFVRWTSHICAPVFLFLAGTSLAFSVARKQRQGVSPRSIDRDLLVRGLLILAVDLTFINIVWAPGMFMLQVMTAIGLAMLLMIPLRRLPTAALVVLALAVVAAAESWMPPGFVLADTVGDWLQALFLSTGFFGLDTTTGQPIDGRMPFMIAYPVVPWWAMMALGWALGRWLIGLRERDDAEAHVSHVLLLCGVAGLTLFAVIRFMDGYGDSRLERLDDSWVQWLHVSKYPPSIAYTALELGLMALIMSFMFRWNRNHPAPAAGKGPLLVFGQTAFFFYVAHIALFELAARLLGVYSGTDMSEAQLHTHMGLHRALLATLISLIVLYPICRWYRQVKSEHPRSVLRYF